MKKRIGVLFMAVVMAQVLPAQDGKVDRANRLIDQSVERLGGWDRFTKIKNVRFKTNYFDYRSVVTTYLADDRANFKMTVGVGPYTERVLIIKDGEIKDHNFLTDDPLSHYEKVKLTCFAKLISGAFTLIRFKDELSFAGTEKYGLKTYHILETSMYDHQIFLYLESDTFLLGRMVLTGRTASDVLYDSMYDFTDPVEVEGVSMPGYWMHSFLGAEGTEEGRNRIEGLQFNTEIEDDFWDDASLHFGSVEVKDGVITGNVVESYLHSRLQWMIMPTNIRWEDMARLDLEQHDDLIVTVEGTDYAGIYFPNKSINPARERRRPGVILAGDISAPYIGLFMLGDVFREKYEDGIEPLMEVRIRKGKMTF